MGTKAITLDDVREQAVGKNLSAEELNLFCAGHEEERMIPTRHGETHVYIYVPGEKEAVPEKKSNETETIKGRSEEKKKYPVLMNFHGGGFVKGHRDQDVVFGRNMAQNAGYVVIDVDYHTAPEYRYPYALEECHDVTKYVVEHPEEFWADLSVLVLIGHSAGANFVCGVEFMALESGAFRPTQLILDYPPLTFINRPEDCRYAYSPTNRISPEKSRMYREWYIDKSQIREITASPLLATQEELCEFPPVLMILAEDDSLSLEGVEFAAKLIDAGVTVYAKRVPGSSHGFTVRRTAGFEIAEEMIFEVLEKQAGKKSKS